MSIRHLNPENYPECRVAISPQLAQSKCKHVRPRKGAYLAQLARMELIVGRFAAETRNANRSGFNLFYKSNTRFPEAPLSDCGNYFPIT
jgi:hypothetical protein